MTSNEKSLANISFINKDFESLWTELLALVPKLTRKWDPSQANESDPLAVLLKLITVAQDKANYNIDKNILELYPLSLTQKASAFNVYDSLGYTMQWYHSGTGKIVVRYLKKPDDIAEASNIVVPRFSQVSNTESSIVFTITENDTTFSDIFSEASLNITQGRCIDFLINGESVITSTNLDSNNRLYFIEPNIAQNGIFVQLNNENGWNASNDWRRVTNLSQVESGTRCYQFGVDPLTNSCYIQFPEDIGSLIGSGLKIKYIVSDGVSGNVLSMTLNQFYNDLKLTYTNASGDDTSTSANDVFSVLNPSAILNGADPADLDEIYDDYKRTTNIVNTLVTLLDYKEYLRDYTNDNIDLVSNVQVSDRTNDLYESYIVKTLTTDHKFSNHLQKTMSAYDLRLYPLNSSSDVTTRLGYDNTFTYPANQNDVIHALDSVKAVNHDFKDQGYPIILTYDLAGQIYLESRVTAQEAREIRSNVLTALYQTFNAYKVDFGDTPDYRKIVDTITNADKRIQYVALNPISDYSGGQIKYPLNYSSSDNSLDITKRSILAGKTPWAVVRDTSNTQTLSNAYQTAVNISLGQEASTTVKLSPADDEGYIPTKNIQAGVFFDTSKNPTILEVGPNEHISFFTPQLKTDVTYANYLFYKVKLDPLDKIIEKNTPYKLLAGESIKFYETKEDIEENNVYAQLEQEDIVLANFKLQATSASETPSLTAKTTISKQSLVQSVEWDENDAIYCSSESVYNNVTGSSPVYTLLSGEYVIYLKGKSKSFVIYGEGTTVRKGSGFKPADFVGKYSHASSSDLSYYQESGSVDSLSQYFVEIPSENDRLIFQSNTILTFGEGYKLQFRDADGARNDFWSNTDILGTGTVVTDMFPRTSPSTITYDEWLSKGNIYYTNVDSLSPSSSDWTALPKIASGSNWQFTYNVSIYSSPRHEQTYYQFWSKDSVNNNNYVESDKYVKHSQALTYLPKDPNATRRIVFGSGGNIPNTTHTLSSSVILASTAAPLTVDTLVEIYSFTISNQKLYNLNDSFSNVTELELQPTGKVTLPNIPNVYFILPYIANDADPVSYLLCRPGKTVDVSNYSKIGNIVSIDASSYYYNANDRTYKTIESLLQKSVGTEPQDIDFVSLSTNVLYDGKFSPLYIPDANEEILNPTQYSSFFNQNHVLNKYSIAKIGNTDSLVVSSLSIQ